MRRTPGARAPPLASAMSRAPCRRWLLGKGAAVDAQDGLGGTPLARFAPPSPAASRGRVCSDAASRGLRFDELASVRRALIAPPTRQRPARRGTVASAAARRTGRCVAESTACAEVLIQAGADVNLEVRIRRRPHVLAGRRGLPSL